MIPAANREHGRLFPVALALTLAVLACYGRSYGHGFVSLDDNQYIVANGWVRQGLNWDSIRWAFTAFHAANWHPLTWLSLMLDRELFGDYAGGYHLMSAVIHACASVVLLAALRRMTGSLWASALVAGLFALHPMRVESVAWASERKDVLSGLCWMGTLWCYARYAERPSGRRYLPVVGVFTAGLLAKPMLVTLPCVLLLLDCWPLGRWPGCGDRAPASTPTRLLLEKLPMLLLVGLSSWITLQAQHAGEALIAVANLSPAIRIANAILSYGKYLWMTLWPTRLAYFYPHPGDADGIPDGFALDVTVAGLALIGCCALVYALRDRRFLLIGWLWYLGTLVPVIGILQVGSQAMADRYSYIPLIGIYIAIAFALEPLARRSATARLLPFALLLLFGVCTWIQTGIWRDDRTLFEHALRVTKSNHVAHRHLGTLLIEAGEFDAAERELQTALALHENYADAHNSLGIADARQGRYVDAARHFSDATRADPRHADAYHNSGIVSRKLGKNRSAFEMFSAAIKFRPDFILPWKAMAEMFEEAGDREQAANAYREVLRLDPNDPDAREGLARTAG